MQLRGCTEKTLPSKALSSQKALPQKSEIIVGSGDPIQARFPTFEATPSQKGNLKMNEAARKERNRQRLTECFPVFAQRVGAVIKDLEAEGFRPRIQDAHRSIPDQLKAFNGGFSKVKFGFHNVTGANGTPESLAVDLLDDDKPLNPSRRYIILLAAVAQAHGLHPGSFFGLPASLRKGLSKAIEDRNFDPKIKIGFDPTHIEVSDISIAEARAGERPEFA